MAVAEPKLGGDVKMAAAIAGFLTAVAAFSGEEMVGMLVSPIVILLVLFMLVKAPLRNSLFAIIFLAFTLENPWEAPAAGWYRSPFYTLGGLLLTHINSVVNVPVSLSGMDIILIVLLIVAYQRKSSGSKIDRVGWVATPQPLVKLTYLTFGGLVWVVLVGLYRGGTFQMAQWQIDRIVHLPLVFLLCHIGLRGQKDHESLAKVLVSAAVFRAIWSVCIIIFVTLPPDENGEPQRIPWTTSHHDSMLFACACVILLASNLERIGKAATRRSLLLLPILAAGMWANNRRMVWVQVAAVFATLYFATPTNKVKRKIKMVLLLASPLIFGYLAAGWDSTGGGIFKPVEIVRSVVDPQTDASSQWREIENYNLLFTFKQYWVLGLGYGNAFWEMIAMPAVDYSLERYVPHNSLLGLWCFTGILGYTAFTLQWAAGAFFAMRSYWAAKAPKDRVAALVCLGSVLIYMIQNWGDMGLGSWTGVFIVGPAMAIAGKLAVSLGAWPSEATAKKPVPAAVHPRPEGQVA
jgi:hypothetical protein